MDTLFFVGLYLSGTVALCWILWVFVKKTLFGAYSEFKAEKQANIDEISAADLRKKKALPVPEKKLGKGKRNGNEEALVKYTHPWLLTNLKGHSSSVESLGISLNGKLMASCAADRTVLVWVVKDFLSKEHKQIRVNIEFDHANRMFWSPDNKAFIISKEEGRQIEVFKLGRKPDGSVGNIQAAFKFPKFHEAKIISLGIAVNGKCVMSCSMDGRMVIWSLKGQILEKFNVTLDQTHCAQISPCGMFLAAGGEKTHVNRYALQWKDTTLQGVTSLPPLKFHESGVYSLDFKFDSSMIATLTKTGTWRLFDTTGSRVTVHAEGTLDGDLFKDLEAPPVIKISLDGLLVFVAVRNNVYIYSAALGNFVTSLDGVHDEYVRDIILSHDSLHFITCGDKIIRVYENIAGMQEKIRVTKIALKDPNLTAALRIRLGEDVARTQRALLDFATKLQC